MGNERERVQEKAWWPTKWTRKTYGAVSASGWSISSSGRNCNFLEWYFRAFCGCRIQKDAIDHEKVQATLMDGTLTETCDLKRALEILALLEAQVKEMNPNLDSISEYAFSFLYAFLIVKYSCWWSLQFVQIAQTNGLYYYYRYRRKASLYTERVEELNTVTQQRDDLKKQYDELRKRRQVYPLYYCIFIISSEFSIFSPVP